jgi:hypothetical protein
MPRIWLYHKVEEARLVAMDIAFGTLLVEGIDAQEGVVVRSVPQAAQVQVSLFELAPEVVGHGTYHPWCVEVRGL